MSRYRRVPIGDDWVLIERSVNLFGRVLWWRWIDTVNIYKDDEDRDFDDKEGDLMVRNLVYSNDKDLEDLRVSLGVFERLQMFEQCEIVRNLIKGYKVR